MWKEAKIEENKIKNQNAKLRSNAILSKYMENPMDEVEVKIVTTRKQYFNWSFTPKFKREK